MRRRLTAGPSTATASDDLARFGRSLERLQVVLLDEFVTTVVEVVLLERAKFAGYLMRCSFLLSSGNVEEVASVLELTDISPDLQETHRVLDLILNVCEAHGAASKAADDKEDGDDPTRYAALAMHERILSLVAEKLLEVAVDLQGMTPDLLPPGLYAVCARRPCPLGPPPSPHPCSSCARHCQTHEFGKSRARWNR